MSDDREINHPIMTKIVPSGKKERSYAEMQQKDEDNDKIAVKFRCDFHSTQVEVMLARGWTQVMVLIAI